LLSITDFFMFGHYNIEKIYLLVRATAISFGHFILFVYFLTIGSVAWPSLAATSNNNTDAYRPIIDPVACLEFNHVNLESLDGNALINSLSRLLNLINVSPFFTHPVQIPKSETNLNPCADRGTSIVALGSMQSLFICENSSVVSVYNFGAGTCGFGKFAENDRKTPVGSYSLGEPRHSTLGFGTFIPIHYPTALQNAQGYTGASIGIHGPKILPPTIHGWLGPQLGASYNWTAGCLALDSYKFIDEVAKFVRENPRVLLHILAP
jgi:hypothetical protein